MGGVQIFFVFTVLIGVIIMNIYIGLLGNLYDSGKAHRHQLHSNLKAHFTYRLLLYKYWFSLLPCYFWASGEWASEGLNGCWITYDRSSFIDEDEVELQVQALDNKFMQLKEELRER